MTDAAVLRTRDVAKTFTGGGQVTHAVSGVDFFLVAGRSVGIAGESGSGKTTLLRLLLGLERPTTGSVTFRDGELADLDHANRREYRRSVQAVFQDPGASFDPRSRVWKIITEPAWMSRRLDTKQRRALAAELLRSMDLPADYAARRPHQLSGGERQRVAIARALSSGPEVIILDEPVTALDVSVRGSIINLLLDKREDVTYVVVSHDLTVIHHLTDDLYVMFQGIVVERGPTEEILQRPKHPYTQLLVASVADPLHVPPIDRDDIPPETACPYLHRCPEAMPVCTSLPGPTGTTHVVRCHLYPDTVPDSEVRITIRNQ